MEKYDRMGSFFWLALGAVLCVGSVQIRLGTFHRPGPGFMPFLSGVFLMLFGVILMVSTLTRADNEKEETKSEKLWTRENWKGFSLTLLALFGYALSMNFLGFYTTTFLFLFFLFKLTAPRKWLMPLAFSGASVILSYLIFSLWLMTQFPGGIFGF
jgi:hypothetical protein